MNRRNFLSLLGMSVGGLALEQAIPFNRVWSFPKNIVATKSVSLAFHRDALGLAIGDRVSFGGDPGLYTVTGFTPSSMDILIGRGELGKAYGIEIDEEINVSSHI